MQRHHRQTIGVNEANPLYAEITRIRLTCTRRSSVRLLAGVDLPPDSSPPSPVNRSRQAATGFRVYNSGPFVFCWVSAHRVSACAVHGGRHAHGARKLTRAKKIHEEIDYQNCVCRSTDHRRIIGARAAAREWNGRRGRRNQSTCQSADSGHHRRT
jgi:hypothetical protein